MLPFICIPIFIHLHLLICTSTHLPLLPLFCFLLTHSLDAFLPSPPSPESIYSPLCPSELLSISVNFALTLTPFHYISSFLQLSPYPPAPFRLNSPFFSFLLFLHFPLRTPGLSPLPPSASTIIQEGEGGRLTPHAAPLTPYASFMHLIFPSPAITVLIILSIDLWRIQHEYREAT